jgi:CheY-like chemotaxis protein
MRATANTATEARKRILIVDDNQVILDVMSEFLGEAYTIDPAGDATIALQHVKSNRPDLILLDVNMPGMDGIALLVMMRKMGLSIPVFIVTGYDAPGMADKAKKAGATAYLVKPVDLRTLDKLIADQLKVTPLLADD